MKRSSFVAAPLATVLLMLSASLAHGSHALSPERYAALDAVYTALVPLDGDPVPASALTAARRACSRLDRADALLGPLRGECFAVVRAIRATERFADCSTRRSCSRASAGLRKAITRYLSHARSANRAIDVSVRDPACRLALRVSASELKAVKRLRSALRAVERALRTGSNADVRRAERRLDAIDDPSLSAKQERERFRRECG